VRTEYEKTKELLDLMLTPRCLAARAVVYRCGRCLSIMYAAGEPFCLDCMEKEKEREECTTREDTECDYNLESIRDSDERQDDREDYEERYR
jgi:hypothetical protein